jgi:hypothetical protein
MQMASIYQNFTNHLCQFYVKTFKIMFLSDKKTVIDLSMLSNINKLYIKLGRIRNKKQKKK